MADHELRVLPLLAAILLFAQSGQGSQEEGFMSGLAAEFGRCMMSVVAHDCECMAQGYGSAGQNPTFSIYPGDLCGATRKGKRFQAPWGLEQRPPFLSTTSSL